MAKYKIYLKIDDFSKSNLRDKIIYMVDDVKELEQDIYKIFYKIKVGINLKINREYKDMIFYKKDIDPIIYSDKNIEYDISVGGLTIKSVDNPEKKMVIKIMVTNKGE